MAVLLMRHHKKEKSYGPSPSNNYTSGAGKKSYFKRNKNRKTDRDAEELGAVGGGSALIAEEKSHHKKHNGNDIRPSHDTGMTGSTAAVPETTTYGGSSEKYGNGYGGQPERNNGYQNHNQQGTGTAHGSAHPTTDRSYGHGINQQQGVIHDPNPYAEVHHGGMPHQATHGDSYAR